MNAKRTIAKSQTPVPRRYRSPNIPMSAIRRYARQIGERFQPEKVILFGSYAYGKPHADSDVDLLVVMPAARESIQSARIRLALRSPFPLDLIVRTPRKLFQRLKDGNWFLKEIVEKGKVLYGNSMSRSAASITP